MVTIKIDRRAFYVLAGLLVILGLMFLRESPEDVEGTQHGHLHPGLFAKTELEHEHEHRLQGGGSHTRLRPHEKRQTLNLRKIAGIAFVLGFAHEEEFALLAFVMAGLNPWVLMTSYALAVTASIMAATVAGAMMFEAFEPKITKYQAYLPKISGIILLAMAAIFGLQALT